MLVGHFGVGLGLKARYPSVPLLPILVACQLPDWLFIALYAAGWETLSAEPTHVFHPTTFAAIPFSHDFSMVALYAGLAASVGLLLWSSRWALAVGWAVASHVLLDWLVHAPDIGVGGPWFPVRVGLDLWRRAPYAAWGLELSVLLVGGLLYVRAHQHSARAWSVPSVLVAVHAAALSVW
jgi:hypothetical protein